jgi:uncharacterized membrane protein
MLGQLAAETAHTVRSVVELIGVAIIAAGAVITLLIFLYHVVRRSDLKQAVANLRSDLGRAILLGLEFLVAADIINTVAIEPTLDSVITLGGIVLIRTLLSFSLEVEIEGRWPWQRGTRKRGET